MLRSHAGKKLMLIMLQLKCNCRKEFYSSSKLLSFLFYSSALDLYLPTVFNLNTFKVQINLIISSRCMNFIHKIPFPPWQEGKSNFCFCASASRVNHPRQQWRYHLASCGHKCFAFGRVQHVIAINQTQVPRKGYPSALGASTHTQLQTCIVLMFF